MGAAAPGGRAGREATRVNRTGAGTLVGYSPGARAEPWDSSACSAPQEVALGKPVDMHRDEGLERVDSQPLLILSNPASASERARKAWETSVP